MKILIIAPTPFFADRGTHIRILEEALALEKRGHKITIATYHIGKDIDASVKTSIDVRRIRRMLFWYKKLEAGPDWQKIILDAMLIRKAFYLARTEKPDIIHGHLHEGALIGWIVKKSLFWRKMKLVADFHGSLTGEMVSHGYLKKGLHGFFRRVETFINTLGDYAITSSAEGLENISQARQGKNCAVVLDGTNLDSFNDGKNKSQLRQELEISQDKFVVGYTGGLVSNKGIDYLLGAIVPVLQQRKDVFFLIGGFPADHVRNFVAKNKLEDSVRVVSPLDYFHLPDVLKVCDVAVDPKDSDVKQASGKMLNYMSAGLPVVCFDKPNNRNYLAQGGYFCREMNAPEIAEGILHLAGHPEEVRTKGALNKLKAEEFGWDKAGEKIAAIYEELIGKE